MRRRFGWSAVWVTGLALLALAAGGDTAGSGGAAVEHPTASLVGSAVANVPVPSEPDRGGNVTVAPAFTPNVGTEELGPLPAGSVLSVEVGLALSDPLGLEGLLSAEYTPGTSEYHHFLSVAALTQQYGPTGSSVASATSYFEGFGLAVTVSPDRLMLTVEGPSDRVSAAFGTVFDRYRTADGALVFSHPTSATLPSIAPWSGVYGLGNVSPMAPSVATAARGTPASTPETGCSNAGSTLLPCQIWQAYDESSLIEGGDNGSGVRVTVVDPYSSAEPQPELENDLATFSSVTGVPVGSVSFEYPVPSNGNLNQSTNTIWADEDALDLEWARASAPGSSVAMVFSPNAGAGLYEAIDWVVAHQATDVLSLSWGEPDVGVYNAFNTPCSSACNASTDGSYGILSPVLAFAAAEGITVVAASGDCGSADGTSGVSTNYPASDPDVTGVGGTVLSVDSSGNYLSEVAWSGNASGAASPGCENQGGSGGGYSPFPRPWWQDSVPIGPKLRGVPDVAADAATGALIVLGGSELSIGGTSLATPIWAGVAAIADQDAGRSLGLLNPSLYALAAGANYSTDFHDILSGSNGYSAGVGWDPVTGLGTPIAGALVPDLAHGSVAGPGNLSTFVYGSPRFGRAPLTVDFHVNATGGSGTYPLLGVSFGDGNASFATGGTAAHTYPTPGVYAVQSYVADSEGNYSVSPPIVVVVGGGSALSVDLSASTQTPTVGEAVLFTASVSGGVGPYVYNFTFGDGTFLLGSAGPATDHDYGAAGGFCAEVVVSDAAEPVDGGASARVAVAVGGAALPDCGNDSTPLTIAPVSGLGARDAPADFPALFNVSGGSTDSGTLSPSVQFSSSDPYTAACGCAIFRSPGTYEVIGYANDSENQQVRAFTNLTVAPPLTAAFTAEPLFGVAPLTVHLAATASGGEGANAAETVWSLPNGTTVTGADPTVTLTSPGEQLVVAHLADAGNGNASEAFLVDVAPTSTASPEYLVGTVAPAVDVPVGSTLNFSATALNASGAVVPATFLWTVEGSSGAHRGSFNWSLASPLPSDDERTLTASVSAVFLGSGDERTASVLLPDLGATGPGTFLPRANALGLMDEGAPSVGASPLVWSGEATATGPGTVGVVWEFPGGVEVEATTAEHTFGSGEFTVTTVASDSFGDVAVDVHAVTVAGALNLTASLSTVSGIAPLTVTFRASASAGVGPPYRYLWTFGTPGNASTANGTVTFAAPGTYAVSVAANDTAGDAMVQRWSVVVDPASAAYLPTVFLIVGGALGGAIAVVAAVVARTRRAPPGPPRGATL